MKNQALITRILAHARVRFFVVFILGFSSGLPMALTTSSLQAWFASSGLSIFVTSTLSLISLPYAYRTLWAPMLDSYSLFSIGKRRSWMLGMQILMLLGFNLMAWLTPEQHPYLLALLALALACCSATQDVAIDAHRIEYLSVTEHALGASLATFGYRLALLFSGGFALVVAEHWGWAFTYRLMGMGLCFGMLAVLLSREPKSAAPSVEYPSLFITPIKELLARPYIISLLLFIFCYKLGEAFTATTSGIVMPFLIQGLHFSLATIGYVNKILGISALMIGGLIAGISLLRYSLYCSLLFFGLVQALTNILFVILALAGKSIVLLSLAVFFDNLASGMGSTALLALFMRIVNKQFTGTQFSVLIAISTIPRILSGPIAAVIQAHLGWVGLYQLSVLGALLFIPLLLRLKAQINNRL